MQADITTEVPSAADHGRPSRARPEGPGLFERSRSACVIVATLVMAAATAATLATAEIGFRLLAPQSIVPRYVEAGEHGIRANIPNVRGMMVTKEFRHAFSTNAQGFRGTTDYAVDKPDGVYRVIVLGDSTTLGHGVSDGETFSAVAEGLLNRIRRTEVINMGVSGFGTAEELIQLQTVGFRFQPDLVVLAYFPNDPYNNVVSQLFAMEGRELVRAGDAFTPALYLRDHLAAIPGYSFLCQHSHLLNFVRSRFSAFFMDYLGKKHQSSIDIHPVLSPTEDALTTSLLREVRRTAVMMQGVPLVVLNIPVILDGHPIQNFPEQAFDATDPAVAVIDVERTVYRGHAVSELSYPNDAHPKPFAHRLIGAALAQTIQGRFWSGATAH